MLEQAIASGICSMGVDVMLIGPLPTPGIAFITESMRADAGVVISASHNPYQDNGIKFFVARRLQAARRDRAAHRALVLDGASTGGGRLPRAAPHRQPDRQGQADRRRHRPLRGLPQVALPPRPDARRASPWWSTAPTAPPTRWRRRSSRSWAPRSSRSTSRPTARTSTTSAARSTPRAWPAPSCATRPTSAWPWTATPTGSSWPTSGGGSSTATPSWRSWGGTCWRAKQLAKKTVVATVMSNLGLEAALGADGRQGGADRGGRPLRGRGDAPPRLQLRRRAVRPPHLPRPRHHRRRRGGRAQRAGGDEAGGEAALRAGRLLRPLPAGAGQRAGAGEAAARRAAQGGRRHRRRPRRRWGARGGCWCAPRAPRTSCACWWRGPTASGSRPTPTGSPPRSSAPSG